MVTKFWQIRNEAAEEAAELLLYGPISETTWCGDEVTPKAFADDLKALGGKALTVRVNSPGGDVFAAQAIYNQLKSYAGNVTMRIDGLAASAATIITCAGDTVIMPDNAMFMIHNPATVAVGGAEDMRSAADMLDAVRDTIVNVYMKRCGNNLSNVKLRHMMDDETWMTAQEAMEYGFIDRIDDTVVVEDSIDGNMLIVGSVACSLNKFKNIDRIKELLSGNSAKKISNVGENPQKEERSVNTESLLQKIADKLGVSEKPEAKQEISAEDAVKAERQRVAALEAMLTGDAVVDSIIQTAKANGETADKVQPYVEALRTAQENAPKDAAVQAIENIVKDEVTSGAENVAPSVPQADEAATRQQEIDEIVNLANQKRG